MMRTWIPSGPPFSGIHAVGEDGPTSQAEFVLDRNEEEMREVVEVLTSNRFPANGYIEGHEALEWKARPRPGELVEDVVPRLLP